MKYMKTKNTQDIQDDIFRKIRVERRKLAMEIEDKIYRRMSAEKKLKLLFDFMNVGLELDLPRGTEIPLSYLRLWLECNYKKMRI